MSRCASQNSACEVQSESTCTQPNFTDAPPSGAAFTGDNKS